jgi:putative ABC transport system permease protein
MVLEGSRATDQSPSGWVTYGQVHFDYFRDLDIPVLQGRDFTAADVDGPPDQHRSAIIVNDRFVERVLGGGSAVGRRLRFTVPPAPSEQWFEIIGVVETFGANVTNPDRSEAMYMPLGPADLHPMRYIIEVGDSPTAFLSTLRAVAADVDPEAIVQSAQTMSDLIALNLLELRAASIMVFVLSAVGMVLAATGLYALMSFTVSQRTREIGIRTALGATRGRVIAGVLREAIARVGIGVAIGALPGGILFSMQAREYGAAAMTGAALTAAIAAFVVGVAVVACIVPVRRALRIQPTDALRVE